MGKRIVFVDECHFTNRTNIKSEWSAIRTHIKTVNKYLMIKPWQMVTAVSEEFGLEASIIFDQPIDSKMFVQIYDQIKSYGEDFVMFGDNATWHNSKFTKAFLKARQSDIIFNLPYLPIMNPIETVFL